MDTRISAKSAVPLKFATGVGLVVIALYVAILLVLMERSSYDVWGALLVAPVLMAVTYPAFVRQARRENDRRLLLILTLALTAKLLASLLRYYQAIELYDVADARGYDRGGEELAARFLAGNFDTSLPKSLSAETDFMYVVTGVVYALIRPTLLGGFVFFSWLSFLGMYLFYRAFELVVSEGRTRTYALLLFFLPSLLFWPSSIGKEAWSMLGLGVAAYGASRLLMGHLGRGTLWLSAGLLATAAVRPHFAGILAIAIVTGYLVQRRPERAVKGGRASKIVALIALAAAALLLVGRIDRFFRESGFEDASVTSIGGISSVLGETSFQTQQGGSAFSPVNITSPSGILLAPVTVLFRPLPFEADSILSAVAAIEGVFLAGVVIVRWSWVLAALRSIRRQAYLGLAAFYCAGSIIALSSIANFGILSRQRVLLFPMVFVLLSVPPPGHTADTAEGRSSAAAAR